MQRMMFPWHNLFLLIHIAWKEVHPSLIEGVVDLGDHSFQFKLGGVQIPK